MAKVIPYRSTRGRKLGFKKVRNDLDQEKTQLDLFENNTATQRTLEANHHVSHFFRALELDGVNDVLAEYHYKEAIRENQNRADAFCNLGIVHARNGNTSQAIDAFTQSLADDGRHLEAHFNLANMYYDLKNYNLAATHYEVAIAIQPDFLDANFNLALTYMALEKDDAAVALLESYLTACDEDDQRAAEKLLLFLSLRSKS